MYADFINHKKCVLVIIIIFLACLYNITISINISKSINVYTVIQILKNKKKELHANPPNHNEVFKIKFKKQIIIKFIECEFIHDKNIII